MTDIFGSQPAPAVDTTTPAPTAPTVEALLSGIKNEQGQPKYQSVEKALEALQHSQEFIPTLKNQLATVEQELAQAKAEAAQAKRLEDVVAQLTTNNSALNGEPPPAASGLGEADVIKLVQQSLVDLETKKVATSNVDAVQAALTAKFGDKTADVVAAKAAELGTTSKALGDLAAQSPQLVLTLFGTAQVKNLTPTTGSVVVPPINRPDTEIKRPEKSILVGATSKEQTAHLRDIREKVHARLGVTT